MGNTIMLSFMAPADAGDQFRELRAACRFYCGETLRMLGRSPGDHDMAPFFSEKEAYCPLVGQRMRAWTVVDDAFVAGMADKDNLEWLSAKIFFPVLVSALDMNAMDVRVLLLNKGKTVTRGSRAGIALQRSAEIAAALADDMDIVAARTSVLRVLSETGAGVRFRNAWASLPPSEYPAKRVFTSRAPARANRSR